MSKNFSVLKKLLLKNKFGIVITYSLYILEIFSYLLMPYLLGNAVDDLINKSYKGFIILLLFLITKSAVTTIRRLIDTRVYTKIYTNLVTNFLCVKSNDKDISKLNAHSVLAREFVNFLEYDLSYILYGVLTLVGSVSMLFFYNKYVLCICLIIFILVLFISKIFGKKVLFITKKYNNEFEKQIDIISSGNLKKIQNYYVNLRNLNIKKSNLDAYNYVFMEIFSFLMIASSLIVLSYSNNDITAGMIIGVYNYIIKFSDALYIIPRIVERYAVLFDITERIELEGIKY